jgi:hypothetical protein
MPARCWPHVGRVMPPQREPARPERPGPNLRPHPEAAAAVVAKDGSDDLRASILRGADLRSAPQDEAEYSSSGPTLLELQQAMRASLVERDDGAAAAMLAAGLDPGRLNIYRNTFVTGVTKALRLSFPAVERLVGAEFFEGAAAVFIAQQPPRAAYLDLYGEGFPAFLGSFAPAAALLYLADVARLEWAVNRALHAADAAPLALERLGSLAPEDQSRICFVPHPTVSVLRCAYPVDAIWRGVLASDDAALATVDVAGGPVHLLVERGPDGVQVHRLDSRAWRFAQALLEGRPLAALFTATPETTAPEVADPEATPAGDAMAHVLPDDAENDSVSAADPAALLAEHLAANRFVDFFLAEPQAMVPVPVPAPTEATP